MTALPGSERAFVRRLREETGCSLQAAHAAAVHAEGQYELAVEYLQRGGIALAFSGTPEEQKARRFPKWAAWQRGVQRSG